MKFSVIPEPLQMETGAEPLFTLTRLCEIECDSAGEKAKKNLLKFLGDAFSMEVLGTGRERVVLRLSEEAMPDEGYRLTVRDHEAVIVGGTERGIFYGVQTLKQLLLQGELSLPRIRIEDSPRFPYRGFMLDCARYFFTKEAVFVFLEMMAMHKLNKLHLHLSDDQGFRVMLEDNILLTEIGSYRSHTNFGKVPHSGFYTKQDIREIVAFAQERCIDIIPEIDSPGHSVSMIAAYPQLSCFDRELTVATGWGIKHDVLCVGKESTYDFIFSVFDELMELFPGELIHLGGDEVPTMRWELCPHCRKKKEEMGLQSFADLHTYYLGRVAAHIESRGRKAVMWNDRPKEKNVSKSVVWQLWNSEMSHEEAVAEMNSGRDFIISCSDAYYLDLPYALTDLQTCYEFEPAFEGIREPSRLMGAECCLWGEYVPTMAKAGYCTYPRLGAFAERVWSAAEKKDYTHFCGKLENYYAMLDCFGIDYAKMSRAMPGALSRMGGRLYWERRKLHWGGLHNLIDDFTVKNKYTIKEKKQ
ncbi:MAG: beta-N-acetylhexosaminidase [Oscillospiraceae bacterium]|nr:beta-N-acetylhexosaminidase [Oscillospiraceae bacterium]